MPGLMEVMAGYGRRAQDTGESGSMPPAPKSNLAQMQGRKYANLHPVLLHQLAMSGDKDAIDEITNYRLTQPAR